MATVTYTLDRKNLPQLTPEEAARLDAICDEDIDYSEIPELDDAFFATVRLVSNRLPHSKHKISLWVDDDVLAWLKAPGRGYQTRANRILRAAMESDRRSAPPAADPHA